MIMVFEVKKGLRFPEHTLREFLPDVEVALFFAKLYELKANEVSELLKMLFKTDVVQALTAEGCSHSEDLQDYLLELGYEDLIKKGDITLDNRPPRGQILPEVWKAAEIEVAKSIKDVAAKIGDMMAAMPGKQGRMVFRSMMTMNAKRPLIGDYKARIEHARQLPNLVVLDVSGSMTEETVRTIVDDVVAMAYYANAHLAIVSNHTYTWAPGEYNTDVVLQHAEYFGTHYETLVPLFENRHWGAVVTIADYDSSWAAKEAFERVVGQVEVVLDISLVTMPTFLSEVIGTLATEVRPLMVADSYSAVLR